ncbi:hypothetical protein GCM10007981_03270 [Thermocladium modestius]|uniref:Uncharacterized protein n=1 Tax=Thermocladium modestius TaxID=62609 RepID=A0A830GU25_9CREN|nr:hypothetical protein [Thermocladium modestius]GGP19467.1 hypothetical protein GCM10007981_03270 [Thermocladium modestius]
MGMAVRAGLSAEAYYASVAPLIVRFTAGRRSAVVRGSSKASRSAVVDITSAESLLELVREGWIDVMTSVSRNGLIDTFVFDVKGTSNLWLSEDSSTVFHLAIQAIRESLSFFGVRNTLAFFDGMNGFKVIAPLDGGVERGVASMIVEATREAFERAAKKIRVLRDNMGGVTIGSNTMLKVGMLRVPLSLHWSTRMAAVPVIGCARNFSTIYADPSRVLRDLSRYSEAISELGTNEAPRLDPSMDELRVIYELKTRIASNVRVECAR